jgi:hypothetical protein
MLSAIASDPTVIPLWITLLFAASLYPLGLLLPGCQCCQSGCAECGVLATGYADPQNAFGRMCCTGSRPAEVTVRITNSGPASSSVIERGTGGTYTKTTRTFQCSDIEGDYVIAAYRIAAISGQFACGWTGGDSNTQSLFDLYPESVGAFPGWRMRITANLGYQPVVRRVQTCSGFPPGPESCTVGTTTTVYEELHMDETGAGANTGKVIGSTQSSQQCNPAGLINKTGLTVWQVNVDTGCRMNLEIVA